MQTARLFSVLVFSALTFPFMGMFGAPAVAAEFRLTDGSLLRGELLTLEDSVAVIRNPILGDRRVPRAAITSGLEADGAAGARMDAATAERVEARRRSRYGDTDPAGQSLFLLPTAFTPERGTWTFRDFELLFLAFGYSPSATTVVTGGFLFPAGGAQMLSVGVKQQIFHTPSSALAVTANYTDPTEVDAFFNSNLVFSHRIASSLYDDAFGMHGGLGLLVADGGTTKFLGGGVDLRLTRRAKFIVEYAAPLGEGEEEAGVLNLGLRLHGKSLSADIAGMRPLGNGDSDLLFLPLLVITYRF